MKKSYFLDEISVVASNLFSDHVKDFNFGVVACLESWNKKISGKVQSDYDKLAIKVWPEGSLKERNNFVARDKISKILIFETECHLEEYFALGSDGEREQWLYSLLEKAIEYFTIQDDINSKELLNALN